MSTMAQVFWVVWLVLPGNPAELYFNHEQWARFETAEACERFVAAVGKEIAILSDPPPCSAWTQPVSPSP